MSSLRLDWQIPEHLSHIPQQEWEAVLAECFANAITALEERDARRARVEALIASGAIRLIPLWPPDQQLERETA